MKYKFVLLIFVISIFTGCSTYPKGYFTSKNTETGESSYSSNSEYSTSGEKYSNSNNQIFPIETDKLILTEQQPSRIKYHKLNSLHRNIVIEGILGINADKYPVILDTGSSQPVVLNAALVRKNNLPIYNENINADYNGKQLGTCELLKLDIGDVTLEKWPCIYFESGKRSNIFGMPIASSSYVRDNIILGLPLLREFKYIIFDNINRETELSYHKSFEPLEPEKWKQFPIFIEEDFHGNAFLFVRMNVAGYETELQLDTGSGRGMAIGERLWDNMSHNVKNVKLKKGKDNYPYIGNLSCTKGKIYELEFGDRTIYNAQISIFENDCPLLDGCEGLVGMQYFSDTVFVLDFENDIIWIKE